MSVFFAIASLNSSDVYRLSSSTSESCFINVSLAPLYWKPNHCHIFLLYSLYLLVVVIYRCHT